MDSSSPSILATKEAEEKDRERPEVTEGEVNNCIAKK